MSTEAWLTVVGILVTVALFVTGGIITLIGWLLSKQLRQIENELSYIRPLEIRVTRIEGALGIVKQPSPHTIKLPPGGTG